MSDSIKGIYIHIPFCREICSYCDFIKVKYDFGYVDKYLDSLENEMNLYNIECHKIESIYIGGGTPSVLSLIELTKLFRIINTAKYPNLKEFTFEINIEDLNKDKLELLLNNNVNRLSIGIQSLNNDILNLLKRNYTYADIISGFELLKKYPFKRISCDFIININNQSMTDINEILSFINKYQIKHVSIYSLILEKGTLLYNNNYVIDEELFYENDINESLVTNMGFEHYEVSNYALQQEYSFHNLLYWHNEHYYGFGLAACGYLDNYRYYNTKSITKYLNQNYQKTYEYYNDNETLKNEIIMQFRLFNGINIKEINDKYSIDFTKYFRTAIIKNRKRLIIKNDFLYFSEEGKLFLNDLIIDFIMDIKE